MNQHQHTLRRPRVREVSSRFMTPRANPTPKPKDYIPSILRTSASNATTNMSAAARLLHSTTATDNSSTHLSDCVESQNNSSLTSSVPEPDELNSVSSSRILSEKNMNVNSCVRDSGKLVFASPCTNSLDLATSTSDPNCLKHAKRPPRAIEVSARVFCGDSRRGKKGGSQEEAHSLRILHDHYLQWRFANAKAEASALAQRRETERMLNSLGARISELTDSVKKKKVELQLLRRTNTLSTIIESQMPYLDQWSDLEGDYLTSLSGASQALLNSSVQLPLGQNVRADVKEIGEALNSAVKMMELIACHVQSLMPKAEETEAVISELARIGGEERALTEECGHLLFMAHKSRVEECSLRSQVIQFHRNNLQKQELA